jgi:solute carrier family 25 carnitine/acylcarnitine transporter 20/29
VIFPGNFATMIREIPGYAGQFYCYEGVKHFFTKDLPGGQDELHAGHLIAAGGLAGIGGWLASYPMDMIKSKIQSSPLVDPTRVDVNGRALPLNRAFAPSLAGMDGGAYSAYRVVTAAGGIKSLWRGFTVCAARAFPANAAGFYAYELTLQAFRRADVDEQHGMSGREV